VSDERKTEIFDTYSDVPTISTVIPVFLLVTVIQVHTRKKVVNWIALTIKQVMCGAKLIKKTKQQIFPSNQRFEYS